jgi:hypothetical protein
MKSFFRTLILLGFLLLGAYQTSHAQTVYVSKTGKKYHAKNCDLAKTGKSGMTLTEAKKAGFEPCKACKADAIKPEEKKAPAKTGKK